MNARPETFDAIAARLEGLERRVQALERERPETARDPVGSLPVETPVASWPEPLPQFTSVFPLLGSALLGIAGAYLLRAISGASLLPRTVVALIAALYAAAWLFAAARAALRRKLAGAFYAAVSILILAPMLWEMTIRFNAMPGTIAAVILTLYVALAAILGLRRRTAVVFSVAFAGSAIAAVALSVATHRMPELTFLLLAMLIVCESGQRKLDLRGIRLMVALMADLAVWALLLIYRLAPANRTDYPAVPITLLLAAPVLLFILELVVLGRRIWLRGEPIPVLAATQGMVAFGLAAAALAWLTPGSATTVLGVSCLILAAACYAVAYGPVRRIAQGRNFRILSVWATCLLFSAVFMLGSGPEASVTLAIAAVAVVLLANRIKSLTLELQGILFLVVATGASGLAAWAARELAGAVRPVPGAAALAVAGCAVLAYSLADEKPGEEGRRQALHMVPALLAAFSLTAFLALALVHLTSLFLVPDVFHVALIRTIALCSLAIGLAVAGARLGRTAMVRAAYAAVAFVVAKLVFEDLRHGHLEFTAASIFLVALTLIAVPRLARGRKDGLKAATSGTKTHGE